MRHLVSLIDAYRGFRGRSKPGAAGEFGTYPRLTPEESDIVVQMAGTLPRAIDALSDRKSRALAGYVEPRFWQLIPAQLLDTSAGTDEVEAILERIEFGVYS